MKKPKRFYPEEFELKEDRRRAPVITEEIKEIRERAPIIEDRDPEEFEYNLKMKKGGKVKMHKMPGGKIMKDSDMKKKNLGGLIGLGADKLLKDSEGVRSFTKNLGLGGKLLGSYYDKKADSKDKKTGSEQTTQVVAKKNGGPIKKAFIGGMFKKSATATASSGDGGSGGSDSSLMGLLGKSGIFKSLKNKNVTYSDDTSGQTTGGQQTKQVTAKRMGGMVRGGRAEIKGTRPAKLS